MLLERSKRRPVLWRRGGKTGSSLAGKGVFLRVFYRDATIFAAVNQVREVEALAEAGATHALVRNTHFLPKTYGFLGPEKFTAEFREPVARLNDALLMKADLLFRSPTHRVYRLPVPE